MIPDEQKKAVFDRLSHVIDKVCQETYGQQMRFTLFVFPDEQEILIDSVDFATNTTGPDQAIEAMETVMAALKNQNVQAAIKESNIIH